MSTDRIVDSVDEELDSTLSSLSDNSLTVDDDLELSITEDTSVPEKYKGKSVEDIIHMHTEAEKLIGRQGTELGELRRSVNQILQNQATQQRVSSVEVDKEIDSEFDLLEPEKSVDARISKHPSIQRIEQLEKDLAFKDFESNYPGWQNTVNSGDFLEWVNKSPARLSLYSNANGHDYGAASSLLGQWDEWKDMLKTVAKEEEKLETKSKAKALNDGMTESGTSTATSKKKFRKVELQRLYSSDRERYDSMSQEIQQAYLDGRVI